VLDFSRGLVEDQEAGGITWPDWTLGNQFFGQVVGEIRGAHDSFIQQAENNVQNECEHNTKDDRAGEWKETGNRSELESEITREFSDR
jgi:hypothetical protein